MAHTKIHFLTIIFVGNPQPLPFTYLKSHFIFSSVGSIGFFSVNYIDILLSYRRNVFIRGNVSGTMLFLLFVKNKNCLRHMFRKT